MIRQLIGDCRAKYAGMAAERIRGDAPLFVEMD
jgi:hypothetical protein